MVSYYKMLAEPHSHMLTPARFPFYQLVSLEELKWTKQLDDITTWLCQHDCVFTTAHSEALRFTCVFVWFLYTCRETLEEECERRREEVQFLQQCLEEEENHQRRALHEARPEPSLQSEEPSKLVFSNLIS